MKLREFNSGEAGNNPWSRIRALTLINEISKIDNLTGKLVLLAGCGNGTEAMIWKSNTHCEIHACDYINKYIKATKPYADKVFIQDLMEKFSVPDETYDIIYCSEVIEHLPWREPFISECYRMLKPNGWFLITTDNPMQLRNFFRFFTQNSDIFHHKGHVQFYSPKDLSNILRQSGFEIKLVKTFSIWRIPALGRVYRIIAKKPKRMYMNKKQQHKT